MKKILHSAFSMMTYNIYVTNVYCKFGVLGFCKVHIVEVGQSVW